MTPRQWVQDTPLGPLSVSSGPDGIESAYLGLGPETAQDRTIARAYERYFAGTLTALDAIPVAPEGCTPFMQAIYETLRTVPAGRVITYGELAAEAGYYGAARACGAAMKVCPVSVAIPCHRVIGAGGRIGGWNGELRVKRWLLAHEGQPRFA